MNNKRAVVDMLLASSGLEPAREVKHLGHGEYNDSYYISTDSNKYCLRLAKYSKENGLAREADALSRLPKGIAPVLIYFSAQNNPIDSLWIIESYIEGTTPERLNIEQFESMGSKLAQTHMVLAPDHDIVTKGEVTNNKAELWNYLTWTCRSFYSPAAILTDLPDIRVTRLAQKIKLWLDDQQNLLDFNIPKRLLHKDITPSNLLTKDNEVFFIDWEIRDYGDPMSDFATGLWSIELNQGRWRIVLTDQERNALYKGYSDAGGIINMDRISVWETFDMMGVMVFLCHRIHSPLDDTTPELQTQYRNDLESIIEYLSKRF